MKSANSTQNNSGATGGMQEDGEHSDVLRVRAAADAVWEGLQRSFFVQGLSGAPLDRLPEISLGEAQRRAAKGRAVLDILDGVDIDALPREAALDAQVAAFAANNWAGEEERYWLAFDPSDLFPGIFSVTAYAFGNTLHMAHERLAKVSFETSADCDRYLSLIDGYAALIEGARTRLAEQAARGYRIHKPILPAARELLDNFIANVDAAIRVDEARIKDIPDAAGFQRAIADRIAMKARPALTALRAELSEAYAEQAPDEVGIGQFDGGEEVYRQLVRMHLSMDVSPEEAHEAGHERMAQVQTEMAAIRADVGFDGTQDAFHHMLRTQPPYGGASPEAVQAKFDECRDLIESKLADILNLRAHAAHQVRRLDPALEGSMTFGFYTPPSPENPVGTYYFNGRNMSENGSLVSIPSLLYHEIVPGHHFHFATQMENDALHPIRKNTFVNAFNEAWAEYSATLAGEIGLYRDPYERYGRLLMDAFLTSRLIVDTGMNLFGWKLEKARDYMRRHTMLSEAEIRSETVRYSCDIPAQALAYKLGDTKVLQLREKAKTALGSEFDLKTFNDLIVGGGAMPLGALEWSVDRFIAERRAA